MFFKHFGSKNQLPGFYISRTLVENGLKHLEQLLFKKRFPKLVHGIITRIDINFIVHYLHVYNILLMNSLSKQEMRRMVSFGLKIVQFLVSKKVCVINVCAMWEFVENRLIKCNQPSTSQPTFTCSKLTITALEHGVKICSKLTIKTPERS